MHRSTHTPSMFSQGNEDSAQRRLDKILASHLDLVDGDLSKTRQQIPSEEIWRFFVDGEVQEHGKFSEYLLNIFPLDDLDITLKQATIIFENLANSEAMEDQAGTEFDWKNGLLLKYLADRSWKFTEEDCYQFTLADIIAMDKAWVQYENEYGYTYELYIAYQEIFDFSEKINNDFIKKLHHLSTTNVKNTAYDEANTPDTVGEYRQIDRIAYFSLSPEHSSAQGLLDILNKSDLNPAISPFVTIIDPATQEEIAKVYLNQESLKIRNDNLSDIMADPQFLQNLQPYIQFPKNSLLEHYEFVADILITVRSIFDESSNEELAKNIYDLLADQTNTNFSIYLSSSQPDNTLETLNSEMTELINRYHSGIEQAKNPLAKLQTIIQFIQDAHQLHPFADGNGRTLCILLFNHLLMRNGFPPTVSPNISQFNACSIPELTLNTLQGMEDTLALMQGKSIHNINTHEVLAFLESKPHLEKYAESFKAAVEIEEAGKHAQVALKKGIS